MLLAADAGTTVPPAMPNAIVVAAMGLQRLQRQ
jgi:hypothetical protein